ELNAAGIAARTVHVSQPVQVVLPGARNLGHCRVAAGSAEKGEHIEFIVSIHTLRGILRMAWMGFTVVPVTKRMSAGPAHQAPFRIDITAFAHGVLACAGIRA